MNNYKVGIILLLIVASYIIGFTINIGWIFSILFILSGIIYGSFPKGGNWKDLYYKLRYLWSSREDDKNEEKEAEDIVKNIEQHYGNVAIGLSGGVDSAVSAYLLKKQGYNVHAFFMRNWDPRFAKENKEIRKLISSQDGKCQASLDYEDAKKVAEQLDIPLTEVNFVKEYWEDVFSIFLEEINQGITPNPDILCNSKVKFGAFAKWIKENHPEIDYIATGHYADIKKKGKKFFLSEAIDDWKDQTYFLAEIDRNLLNIIRFPLGKITKKEVRKIAKEQNLYVANKKDSMGICFIGKRNFQEFLSNYIKEKSGEIKDIDSDEVVGKHNGAIFYTIGQRRGLDIGGTEKPYFVVEKDIEKNIVYVAMGENHKLLNKDEVIAREINLLVSEDDFKTNNLYVKLRHSNIKYKAKILEMKVDENNLYQIKFKLAEKVFAITPGQELVIYRKGICLGGGKIIS